MPPCRTPNVPHLNETFIICLKVSFIAHCFHGLDEIKWSILTPTCRNVSDPQGEGVRDNGVKEIQGESAALCLGTR